MTADFSVTGRVAVVTGASGGIGRAIATTLCNLGAKVIGVARRVDKLEDWVTSASGHACFVKADLSKIEEVADFIPHLNKPFGFPEILVNAAGLNLREPVSDVSPESFSETIKVNLLAPFFLAQGLVPAMKEKGFGRILNIASLQTVRAFPDGLAYGASKGAVGQMTRAMAEAWSKYGVNTNALAPGFIPTDLTKPVFSDPARANSLANQTCIERNGDLSDIIGPAVFFLSPASRYVTGQVLFVDGGFTAK